ncbi:RNA polymerase sigma-70 factor [Segatella baroniae]|nr:RNA polymerase sigma-70 factor [Segatella baroniae]
MKFTETEFRGIFRKLYPTMALYASRLLQEEDAKDIVQESFMELWKWQASLNDHDHMKAFLYRTIYTKALNLIKHKHITHEYTQAVKSIETLRLRHYNPEHNDVMAYINNAELNRRINDAIDRLPDKCRQIFIMSHIHEMKSKEIARVLNISTRTVDNHIYRAFKLLRELLDTVRKE